MRGSWKSLCLVLVLTTVTSSSEDRIPQCRRLSECNTADCSRDTCNHGYCNEDAGGCVCHGCWSGKSCDEFNNVYQPTFTHSEFSAAVSDTALPGTNLIQLTALDRDTCFIGDCPCTQMRYAIQQTPTSDLFQLDAASGDLSTAKHLVTYGGKVLSVTACVRNLDRDPAIQDMFDTSRYKGRCTIIKIHVKQSVLLNGAVVKETRRRKRAAATDIDNIEFYLISSAVSNNTAEVGDRITFQALIMFPVGTSDMRFEIFGWSNVSTALKVCDARVGEIGSDLSIDPAVVKTQYEAKDNSWNYDRAVLDLGTITNSGVSSTLQLRWNIIVLDSAEIVNGSVYWLSAGAVYEMGGEVWVGQLPVTILRTDDTTTAYDNVDVVYPIGRTMPKGSSTVLTIELYLPIKKTTIIVDVGEVQNEFASICSFTVVKLGKNFGCLSERELHVDLTARADGYGNSAGQLRINDVYNTGDRQAASDDPNNWITIGIWLTVSEQIPSGIDISIPIRVTVAGEVNSKDLVISVTDTIALNPPDNPATPEVQFRAVTPAYIGQTFIYNVRVSLPENVDGKYKIYMAMPKTDVDGYLTLCRISAVFKGVATPCVAENTITIDDSRTVAEWNLGYLVDIGQTPPGLYKNASVLILQVVAQVLDSMHNTPGKVVKVEASVFAGTVKHPFSFDVALTPAPTVQQIPVVSPKVEFDLVPLSYGEAADYNVGRDQAILFRSVITLPDHFRGKLVVKFLTPLNSSSTMDICDAYVFHVGAGIPCLRKEDQKVDYRTRVHSTSVDVATFDFGPVCQFSLDNNTENNKIIAEAVAMMNTSVTFGDSFWFSASLKVNNAEIIVQQVQLSLTKTSVNIEPDPLVNNGAVHINNSQNSTEMSPGEFFTFLIIITFPRNSSMMTRIKALCEPVVDSSATMIITNMALKEAGRNLACLDRQAKEEHVNETKQWTHQSSSMDKAVFNMGLVTNTGQSHRTGDFVEEDDQFVVDVTVRMTDNMYNTDQSKVRLRVEAELGNNNKHMDTAVITVTRNNNERPIVLLDLDVNTTQVFEANEYIPMRFLLKHDNRSSAEAYNVTLTLYLDSVLEFVSVTKNNFTEPTIQLLDRIGVALQFKRLYFTDIADFTVLLKAHNNERDATQALVLHEVTSNMIWRQNNVNPPQTFFSNDMDSVMLSVNLLGCVSQPLGMESGFIKDCQISGSESPEPTQQPQHARYGSTGWTAATRKSKFARYVQVYFGNLTKVTDVTIKHPAYNPDRMTSYRLMYSNDGINWRQGDVVMLPSGYTEFTHHVKSMQKSRFIRLLLSQIDIEQDKTLGLLVEFYGCTISSDVLTSDVCLKSAPGEEYLLRNEDSRVFLVTPAKAYFCDANAVYERQVRCFSSVDGSTWEELSDNVASLLGYDSTERVLYGTLRDTRYVVSLTDDSDTWMSVTKAAYAKSRQAPGFIKSSVIPWVKNDRLKPDVTTPSGDYSSGSWGANYNGIFYQTAAGTWRQVVDWSTCCA